MKIWGCVEPSQEAVWEDDENQYFSCPMLWMNDQVISWYEEYAYCQEFPGAAQPYSELHPAWLEAMFYYKAQYNMFYEIAHPKKGDKTDQGLRVLKDSFRSRGQ